MFDAILPTTTSIISGETTEERAQALAKTGRVASAGNVYRFLGSMMYNSAELLLARKIGHENKLKKQQHQADKEKEYSMTLFEKADQAYTWFKDNGSLLTKIGTDDLRHLVRFLCHIKKTKGDTFSKHSGSKKKMRERIAGSEPLWTSYSASPVAEETKEEPAESGIDESNIENLKMK